MVRVILVITASMSLIEITDIDEDGYGDACDTCPTILILDNRPRWDGSEMPVTPA